MVSAHIHRCVAFVVLLQVAFAARFESKYLELTDSNETKICVATVNVLAVALSDPTPAGFPTMTSELVEKKKTWINEALLPQMLKQMPCLGIVSLQEVDVDLAPGIEKWSEANGFAAHKGKGTKDIVLLLVKKETFPKQNCTSQEDGHWVVCSLNEGDQRMMVHGGHAPSEGLKEGDVKATFIDIMLADVNMKAKDFKEITKGTFMGSSSSFAVKPDGDETTTCKAQFKYRKLAQTVANSKNFVGFGEDVTCGTAMCSGDKVDGCCSKEEDAATKKWKAVNAADESKAATETCRRASAICSGSDKKLKPELESMFEEMKKAGKETALKDLRLKDLYKLIHCEDDSCQKELPASSLEKYLETQCQQEDVIAVKESRFEFIEFKNWHNGSPKELPNKDWLSDHFALMAELKIKTSNAYRKLSLASLLISGLIQWFM
jgi:hypothetical protein